MSRSMSWPVLLLCASLATAAHGATPSLVVTPDTLRADATGVWNTELLLVNTDGKSGLYPDSLTLEFTSDDPDRSDHPKTGTIALTTFVRLMPPVGAGETGGVTWSAPADFDRGRLVFRMLAHDAEHHPIALEARVPVIGSELSDTHPPILLEAAGQRTDMVVLEADSSRRPAPTIVYAPPQGSSARGLMRWGLTMVARGYNVAIVSPQGSGRSSGTPDRAGPATVGTLVAAVRQVAKVASGDPKRILLWGQREGATAALLAAVQLPEIAGVIAVDADHDPWATYRAASPEIRKAFVAEAGSDSAGWKARSPLLQAEKIAAPVLVLQSADAPFAAPEPAEAFAARRLARDLFIESRLSPRESAPLRRNDVQRIVLSFAGRRTSQHP